MLRTNTTVFLNSPFGKTVFYHDSKIGENTSYFWRWVLKLPRFSKCWFQPLSYISVRMLFFLTPFDGKCSKQLSYQISEHYRLAFLINFLSMDLMNCMLTILPVHQPVVTKSNAVSMYHMMTVHLLLFTCSTIFFTCIRYFSNCRFQKMSVLFVKYQNTCTLLKEENTLYPYIQV